MHVPRREVAALDGLVQVAAVIVCIGASQLLRLGAGDLVVSLVRGEVVLHPETLAIGVDPLVGV